MNKFKALIAGLMLAVTVVGVADAKSRSSSSSRPSVSSSKSYSAPKMSAPKASKPSSYDGGSFFSSKPAAPAQKTTLKSLGFTKPATVQTVKKPSVNVSPNRTAAPIAKTTTTSGGWFSKKTVSSAPAYKAPARKVSSPIAYKSNSYRPRNVTVIQRNYYGGGYGYNRGYGGGYYGNGYGYNSSGSGFGSSLMGAFAGMMIYDALTDNSAEKALQAQVNALTANQQAMNNNLLMMNQKAVEAPAVTAKPQCFLPPDAPLMMNPNFYCGGS